MRIVNLFRFLLATSALSVFGCQSSEPGRENPITTLSATQLDSVLCAEMTLLARLGSHKVDQEALAQVLESGANPNCSCEMQWKQDDILSVIGIAKTKERTWTERPIVVAFAQGDLKTIETLVKHGANLDDSYVLLNSDLDIWQYMLDSGTPIKAFGNIEDVKGGVHERQIKFLVENHYPFDSVSVEYGTQLLQQILLSRKYSDNGHTKVSYLIEAGANPNYVNPHDSTTALGLACIANIEDSRFETIVALLKGGADVNQLSRGVQKTPLQISSYHSNPKSLRALLEAGADVNSTRNGFSPLYTAVRSRRIKNIKVLLEFGADVNLEEPGEKFSTPLEYATRTAHQSEEAAEIAALLRGDQ